MCIYGYSLAIYIPVSILWVINVRMAYVNDVKFV